jgi:hypothetical protein
MINLPNGFQDHMLFKSFLILIPGGGGEGGVALAK